MAGMADGWSLPSLQSSFPMSSPVIHTQDLTKIYAVSEREAGMRAAVQSLVPHRPVLV